MCLLGSVSKMQPNSFFFPALSRRSRDAIMCNFPGERRSYLGVGLRRGERGRWRLICCVCAVRSVTGVRHLEAARRFNRSKGIVDTIVR
jgi:hypothetical protein